MASPERITDRRMWPWFGNLDFWPRCRPAGELRTLRAICTSFRDLRPGEGRFCALESVSRAITLATIDCCCPRQQLPSDYDADAAFVAPMQPSYKSLSTGPAMRLQPQLELRKDPDLIPPICGVTESMLGHELIDE